MATSPYEDDSVSTGSGRSPMNDPYEDRDAVNRARAEAEGLKISEGERVSNLPRSTSSAPQAEAPKARIVSKKELEASGFDNLRDFLNNERGLTRRGSSAPASSSVVNKTETAPSTSIMKQKPVATADTFNAYDINNFAKPKAKEEAPKSTYKKNSTSAPAGRNPGKDKEKSEPSTYKKNSTYAPSGRNVGMKSGGSVSSASRRADGIATKGKTRGKIC